MGAMLFQILFVAMGSALGAAAGWWVRGGLAIPLGDELLPPKPQRSGHDADDPSAKGKSEQRQFEAVNEMMARLHQLTETVAADVGEHNSQIQEINDELSIAGGTEEGVIAVVEKLVKANEVMQVQLHSAEERLQDQSREMELHVREARTDPLTKLFNRRAFDDEIRQAEERCRDEGRPSCLLLLDVDHFKRFNDTYGHQAGDAVLRGVARVFRQSLSGEEVICRYGGEEFAIIFPGSDIETACSPAERARRAVGDEIFEFEGLDLRVNVSAGLAQLQPTETVQTTIKRADDALYECKDVGRNCGHWHDGENCHRMSEPTDTASAAAETEDSEQDEPGQREEDPALDRRDRITGVSNRPSFCNDINRRIAEYRRGGAGMSVLLVDVDRYAQILEEFGGKVGEVVLRATVQFMKATMREMDHIARLDNSRFALLLPGAKTVEASAVSQRLQSAVSRCELPVNGETLRFSVSLGVAEIVASDETEDLLDRAAASLVEASLPGTKDSGLDQACDALRSVAQST